MARERDERSHVRRRKKGCVTGCLTNILLLLGVLSLVFVGAHVLGFVKNDPVTGAPSISLDNVNLPQAGQIQLPDLSEAAGKLPAWPYNVRTHGLTVKTLRAGKGQAVLVCADGYTMLVGGGSGTGAMLCGQMLLSRVNRLSAAVAIGSGDEAIGALPLAVDMAKPEYLFYQDSQIKGKAYQKLLDNASKHGTQAVVPRQGFAFTLGRALVTFVGPAQAHHKDGRNDGLSLRIDYGDTSILITGYISEDAERELIRSRVNLGADVLIATGREDSTCVELVSTVRPQAALLTNPDAANSVRIRLERAGAKVYTGKEYGVMTLYSDGRTLDIEP